MMKFIIVCMMCNSDECFVSDGFIKCDYCENKQKIEEGD
jgi:hypothetical protein